MGQVKAILKQGVRGSGHCFLPSLQRYLFVTVANGFEVYDVIGQEGVAPL